VRAFIGSWGISRKKKKAGSTPDYLLASLVCAPAGLFVIPLVTIDFQKRFVGSHLGGVLVMHLYSIG